MLSAGTKFLLWGGQEHLGTRRSESEFPRGGLEPNPPPRGVGTFVGTLDNYQYRQ